MNYRTMLALLLAASLLGCKTGKNADTAAKREADRQAMKMDDLEKQRTALRTKVQQLEEENTALRKERDDLVAKFGTK